MELTAAYDGDEPVTYQWNKGGTAINGEKSTTYTPLEAGSYTVTVSATGYNSKTSPAVTVTGETLARLGGDVSISPSTDVKTGTELTASYSGTEEVTLIYQWQKDGENIEGATSSKYTPTTAGTYSVTVSAAGYAPKTSAEVAVTADEQPQVTPATITYTVKQTGGTDGTANSTGIVFTFSASVDDLELTAGDIAVSGKASKGAEATLTGSETSWTLPITVNGAGLATVQITKTGIEAGSKNVTVFKEGESAPTISSIEASYTGTAAIYISTPVDSFKTDLTVKAIYSDGEEITLTADEYDLVGFLFNSPFGDDPFVNGTKTVDIYAYYKSDYEIWASFEVTVSTITYTIEQVGGVDGTADSTGIKFTFNTPVDSIIHVHGELKDGRIVLGGKINATAVGDWLTAGSGTTWTLPLPASAFAPGIATVSIDREGIEAGTKTVIVYKAGEVVPMYTVIFNSDGGNYTPETQSVIHGGYVNKPADPTKVGYLFDYWNHGQIQDGQVQDYPGNYEWDFDTKPVEDNIGLFARWIPAYTVTFDSNGGSAVSTQTVAMGGHYASKPADPTKTDAEFKGWYKENTFTTQWNFDTDAVQGNITLYAKWLHFYTVTFNSNGGSPTPQNQRVADGEKATAPTNPTKPNGLLAGLWGTTLTPSTVHNFVEWRKQGESAAFNFDTAITGNITLIAVWDLSPIDLSSTAGANIVAKAVTYINNYNGSGTKFTLVLGENVANAAELTLNKYDVTLTITSVDNTERVISKGTASGAVFTVSSGATLVIDGHVTLQGKSGNNKAVVNVETTSSLELKGYAKITGNTNSGNGGGVYLNSNTGFTMDDNAAIKDNTSSQNGGGVYISNGSAAIMNGGEISGNTALTGGGVYIIDGASFQVLNATVKANIKNNTANSGAQVYANGNSFFVDGQPAGTY
jgi:uncharacterized repeat protein (TIGR02543 family)